MKIQLEGITKSYGKFKALNNFSAEFSAGVYGLLGPNGAGKSTLINIIVGLLKKNGGSIKFDGKDISEIGESYLDLIGYLPQHPRFYGNFTVFEFMRYMCALKGIPKHGMDDKINHVLGFVNLTEKSDCKTAHLSGGMKQRLGIAQAIINDPKFLILDEPTAGLDPKERIRFRNLISQLSEGRTILLATHIVSDVSFIAKELILIKQGTLLMQKTPSELIKEIEGKVWTASVSDDRIEEIIQKFSVSNARKTDNGYDVRIVSEQSPDIVGAELTLPNLEDVYLCYLGKE